MRVAVYNQMFGLNGKSFWANVLGHWAVHYQANANKIWKKTNLDETIKIISKSNADIIGIVEVLEGQEDYLKKELKKLGYNFFNIGRGHKTKYSGLCVQEMIASKFKRIQKVAKMWPLENRLGGGGGIVHAYYEKKKFNLIFVHLGLPSRKVYREQLDFLQNYLKRIKGKVILFGDFNLSYFSLKSYFYDYDLVSGEVRSCSETPIMKWFYNKDVDHIFVNGFSSDNFGFLSGRSDHKLVYVDLK